MPTRRTFLAATAAAVLASRTHSAEREILGAGQIGTRHSHASGKMDALRHLTEYFRVTAIAEANEKARASAEKNKAYAGLTFVDEAALLSDKSVRVVAVETTLDDATATASRAIAAGKHLHLDKPGGADHAAFKAMRQAAEDKGLIVQMGYMLRHQPAFQLLIQAVREGWLGEVQEITATMGKQAAGGLRKELAAIPGHGMFELGCHLVDAVITLLGPPPKIHAAAAKSLDDGLPDHQLAVFEYPQALATIRCNHNDPGGGGRRALVVVGSQGSLELAPLESGRGVLTLAKAQGEYAAGENKLALKQPRGRYDEEFLALAKWIHGEEKCPWNAAHDIAVHSAALRGGLRSSRMNIAYAVEPQLTAEEFVDVLRRSTLAARRPVDDASTISGMLTNANVIVTARDETGVLIGVSRAISDFSYCTYLSDLAVDVNFQRRGIGRELIRRTHEAAGTNTTLILLSAPAAVEYYPHIGMQPHSSCWVIPRTIPARRASEGH